MNSNFNELPLLNLILKYFRNARARARG